MATEVLRTVQQARRSRWRRLGLALGLSLASLAIAAGWWALREGEAVRSALGVELPPGTRSIRSDHGVGLRDDGSRGDYDAVYLAATIPTDALYAHLLAQPGIRPHGPRRLIREDGAVLIVAPPREIPATRTRPVAPVADQIPIGARSWLILWRGPLPPSTAHLAIPPYGES